MEDSGICWSQVNGEDSVTYEHSSLLMDIDLQAEGDEGREA